MANLPPFSACVSNNDSNSRPKSSQPSFPISINPSFPPSLLLLSDSALPLGSFAFSSGLESYLAHHRPRPSTKTDPAKPRAFRANSTLPANASLAPPQDPNPTSDLKPQPKADALHFLSLSLCSLASTTIPYLISAYRHPEKLEELDNDLDASTACTVARRASVAQGRALLGVWERSLRPSRPPDPSVVLAPGDYRAQGPSSAEATGSGEDVAATAEQALSDFSSLLKNPTLHRKGLEDADEEDRPPVLNGHLASLFALVSRALGLSLQDTAYIYLFNHAKAVLSAAVRAGVMGPYQAQGVLAGSWLQGEIGRELQRNWGVSVEEAGQSVVGIDLWGGRHELLYSRIFNS